MNNPYVMSGKVFNSLWRAKQDIARATANEEEAIPLVSEGRYGDAAKHFKRAAECWRRIKRYERADHCEARACECLAKEIQDKMAFSISPEVYLEMEKHLKKAKGLFQGIGELEEQSRISEQMKLCRDWVFPALLMLSRHEYEKALNKFEDLIVEARRIGDSHQASFASGFAHTCRSYIVDDDSIKIEELELAVREFNETTSLGKWPTRATEAMANQCDLRAMKSAREEDYEEATQNASLAAKKWKSAGADKRARWSELSAQQYTLERRLLDSKTIDYLELADQYSSLSNSFREIGLEDEANWCETWSQIHRAAGQNDIEGFSRAREGFETRFPRALQPRIASKRSMRMARVLLDHGMKLQDFLKARVLEHEAFRLESDVRELVRAFDGREIEAEIFAFKPSERLILSRYTKVGRFVHNAPTYEEERLYAEEHKVKYPIEVDVVAEREVGGSYHILIIEIALQIDSHNVAETAKKAGAVEAYYLGKSKFEASEAQARHKPAVDGVWLVTSRDADVDCVKETRRLGIEVVDRDGLNLLLKKFGMRRLV